MGQKFLPFILQATILFYRTGVPFIWWGRLSSGAYGYTCPSGNIELSSVLLGNNPNVDDWVHQAQFLVHEAVESYFALAQGFQLQVSLGMDYTAQYYATLVGSQISLTTGLEYIKYMDLSQPFTAASYAGWLGADGQNYVAQNEPTCMWPWFWGVGRALVFNDAMGLDDRMPNIGCYLW